MPDSLQKLRPDRDLQCYFFQPSAIAAMSEASATGFKVTGSWRQQFDWAVVEWNRNNVFEHPAFRYLPDGDLSGLVLTYEESRTNCVALDSDLFATVDWPYLRVWAATEPEVEGGDPVEKIFYVPLVDHAEIVDGTYTAAYADFTLSGSAVAGDYIGLAYAGLHYTYQLMSGDTLESALQNIVDGMNAGWSPLLRAERTSATLRAYYTNGASIAGATTGANGNRFSLYSYATGSSVWDKAGDTFSNGAAPTKWRFTFDFSSLQGFQRDEEGVPGDLEAIPTEKIRKMRWTYAADLQSGEFERSEFEVAISEWTVVGTGLMYEVAGSGSRRIEDNDTSIIYNGDWSMARGNYSGGTIRVTETPADSFTLEYRSAGAHSLYLGTRYTNSGGRIGIEIDGESRGEVDLRVLEEDVLIRLPLGESGPGTHTLTVTHVGAAGREVYIDFVELAVPTVDLPEFPSIPNMTLPTDWDTDHSVAVAPERTAWMIRSLGFHGRQNHYVGALLFYELHNPDHAFAIGSVTFGGTADASSLVSVTIGPLAGATRVERVIHAGDTPATIALSFAQEFNRGYTGIWASASGGVLTIQSRQLGTAGEANTLAADTNSGSLSIDISDETLTGGSNGEWRTDLTATPRLNRAARDWTRSFFAALNGYGIDATAAFSTELKHGDPSVAAGIAQRGPSGDAFLLPTPALQTNFSTTSLEFWKQVYADCAQLLADAGIEPFLQFGEVQWWYFPHDGLGHAFSGMPFYDAWTQAEFAARYGHSMAVFTTNLADPGDYPDEMEFLPAVIGEFTDAIIAHVRITFPDARFEALYPFDVNQTLFNRGINFPVDAWTPSALTCLKTEGLSLTFSKNLQASESGIEMAGPLGFAPTQRSHLVGLGDATAPWLKEARIATGKGFESVVLFALDQFCLLGYEVPLPVSARRAVRVRR
ncbi:MAG: hypothetical protein ABI811_24015 [Acidobacteriota bacterium]